MVIIHFLLLNKATQQKPEVKYIFIQKAPGIDPGADLFDVKFSYSVTARKAFTLPFHNILKFHSINFIGRFKSCCATSSGAHFPFIFSNDQCSYSCYMWCCHTGSCMPIQPPLVSAINHVEIANRLGIYRSKSPPGAARSTSDLAIIGITCRNIKIDLCPFD